MRKILLLTNLLILVSVLLIAAGPKPIIKKARLSVINKTDTTVYIRMRKDTSIFYYLTIEPNSAAMFTVERETYRVSYWVCGRRRGGELDMSTNMRVTFVPCGRRPGPCQHTEETMIKVYTRFYLVDEDEEEEETEDR